ncbi:bifunctional DNA-formamidopyrimidine glycosylase/DNA-(apurinic or apyrimidinic site) lyase [Brevundimonas halotolerans]|uniref:Formamidopyrimidine-DNA glycosylase n=1 Tax=Brevundimonas halotolerans TaxID=69670 RepID=A0A7W9A3E4_9CAUL|nr:bifunctional DNA-formamidopyrimidine glycosylase/DNA-(apurinic or apyrimidinic site) lyase [Brevundimonas halotolerans]MBB5660732.1 formamidopyrimidine-DNA glycosylase [Brevundimonas halotolerans]
MPELPEVETVRRGLEPVLAGATLDRVRQNRADLRFAFPDRFVDRLEGATVLSVGRRAKYLLMPLSTGETWVTHLGMTGRFTLDGEMLGEFETNAPARGPHEHLSLYATGKGVATRVGYADARRFGFMGLIPTDEIEAHPWFAGLGPEPMGNAFSADHLKARFKDRRQPVKVALLDQRHVAGLGNIYVCEALWRAGISPGAAAGSLSQARLERLTIAARDVLAEAIAAGGSTLRDFANAEGGQGYFQHSFDVYGREGQPCRRNADHPVIRRQVQGGRSTFWCPACQKR